MTGVSREDFVAAQRGAPPLAGDLEAQRAGLVAILTSVPLAADVTLASGELGAIPSIEITVASIAEGVTRGDAALLHLHGGYYRLGSARASAGLAAELARHIGAKAIAIDYRLAPEHPFPAAIDDALAAYRALLDTYPADRIAVSGESAGGGLVVAMLLAARESGLPLPAAAVVFSPWTDLTLSGRSLASKASTDPIITVPEMETARRDYLGDHDAADPLVSPGLGELHGLPPLLIQVGSAEVLVDDAVLLARTAAHADVEVTLEVDAGLTHVFQAFSPILQEGEDALGRAGRFVRRHIPA